MQEQILDALRRGDKAAALDLARGFAVEAPEDALRQRLLALALRSSGDIEGARESMERAIALAPGDAQLFLEHARLLLGVRDLDSALQALDTSISLNPNQLGAYILQAELALGRNDLDEAERLARLAARVAEDHPGVVALQGTIALRRGRADEAITLLTAATAAAPEDRVALYALASAYAAKGHLAFAEQAFRNLARLAPGATAVHLMLTQLLVQQGRPEEAADELAGLLSRSDGVPGPLHRLAGELELVAGRPDRALPRLREALSALPGESRTMAALIETWRRLGDFDDARRTLDAALATSPANDGLWRARLGFEPAGEAATRLVARWRELLPESVAAMEVEMAMHAAEGRTDEAEAVARALLERVPGHVGAEMRVVEGLLERDPADAVHRLRTLRARTDDPAAQAMLDTWLGVAQHESGDPVAALETWVGRNRRDLAGRAAPPPATRAPATWPESAAVGSDAPPVTFLLGLPGSRVERAGSILQPVLPDFRGDRFGDRPPADVFQDSAAWPRIASGELTARQAVATWRAALPGRLIDGAIVDWLPWWDNALTAVLREALPDAGLLVLLRDPRDMLLDWLAFGAHVPCAAASPQAAAEWLAVALGQLATLHEENLLRHRLLRVDDTAGDPAALSAQLADALGASLPPPPAGYFGTRRPGAGAWRTYAGLLAAPFAVLHPVARRLGYPDA